MRWTSGRLVVLALACLGAASAGLSTIALAQPAQPTPRVESRMVVTAETFCSETKLRTTNARIRWSVPRPALAAANVAALSAARQSLEVTVYKNGLDKGQFVTLPISAATQERPVEPLAQPQAVGRPQPRAFQIRLIEIEQPRIAQAADAPSEMGVVVENLEPGVNYTWRLAIDTPAGRIVSPPSTAQARVCPADMVPSPEVPRRKR